MTMWKVWILLKNMIDDLYILCFWSAIIICIQWENLKLNVQKKHLMKIWIWIFFNTLPTQVNQWKNLSLRSYWFKNATKWISRKPNVFFNDGENMKPCFLLLIFSPLNCMHCKIANWDWKHFFSNEHTYEHNEMSFTIT